MDLLLVQELDQQVFRLVEIRCVILIVEEQGWYAKIPRRGECKVMPLDVHEKICVTGMAGGKKFNTSTNEEVMSKCFDHQKG